jgi:precorrin-6Y C5,15-methyltransferase (decarboxylating)
MAHGRAQLFAEAGFLVGSRRLLAGYPDFSGEKIVFGADTAKTVLKLCDSASQGEKIIVLASGDALFHGIGGTFARLDKERLSGFELNIEPAPTAFQTLFSHLGLPWDRARFFSLHQGGQVPAREILSAPLAVVYGGSRTNAVQIAAILVENFPEFAERPAVLAENLGFENEKIFSGTLSEISRLSCGPISILLLLELVNPALGPELALGLDNDFYAHEKGLITSSEVRCAAIAKLRLPPAGVLWDIGAGSGSVGLEAAALRPGMAVYALERNRARVSQIAENGKRLGVANFTVENGAAPDGFQDFPAPDRIFIGGGGEQLADILTASFSRLKAGGILVVSAVTLEALGKIAEFKPESRIETVQIAIARAAELAGKYHFMKNENQITLSVYKKGV